MVAKGRYSYDDFLTTDEINVLRSMEYSGGVASNTITMDNSSYHDYYDRRRLRRLAIRLETIKAKVKADPDQSPLYRPEIARIEHELGLERAERRENQRLSDISASRDAKDYINYYLEDRLHMS